MEHDLINTQILNETYDNVIRINAGGGGTIYKAYHKRLQKEVVLKKIHKKLKNSLNSRGEADILKNLRHSYLPQVLDFIEAGDDVYTVMDFIPGQSIQQLVDNGKKFTEEEVIKYAGQLCEALAYLHSQKPPIIHCDIKPANIMITPNDDVCLIDFNISGVFGDEDDGITGYTRGYAAPEQEMAFNYKKEAIKNIKAARQADNSVINNNDGSESTILLNDGTDSSTYGKSSNQLISSNLSNIQLQCPYKVDTRSDVYSLGATLFYMLTGVKPDNMKGSYSDYLDYDTRFNDGFVHIILKATMNNPQDRYSSAIDMLQDMRHIKKLTKSYKKKTRRKIITICALMTLAAGLIIASIFYYRNKNDDNKLQYEQVMKELDKAIIDDNDANLDSAYNKAIGLDNKSLGAYYYKLLWYYSNQEYKAGIDFIDKIDKKNTDNLDDPYYSRYYYTLANCYFEIEEYNYSMAYYRSASEHEPDNADIYRDYAISCVRAGKVAQAKEILTQAENKKVKSADLDMIHSEISYSEGKFTEAENYCDKCLGECDNDYALLRAYVLKSKIYNAIDNASLDGINRNINILNEGLSKVALKYRLTLLQQLVYYYSECINLSGEPKYYTEAAKTLETIIDNGWASYSTYENLYIVYKASNQYVQAKTVLEKTLDIYKDRYEVYKNLAYTEISIQGTLDNTKRDYTAFIQYYNKTLELYDKTKKSDEDPEITTLKRCYNDLSQGGWFN